MTGFIPRVSARALKLISSPLRLPISPSRPERMVAPHRRPETKTPRWREAMRKHNRAETGGAGRSRTALQGFAVLCITALLPRRCN